MRGLLPCEVPGDSVASLAAVCDPSTVGGLYHLQSSPPTAASFSLHFGLLFFVLYPQEIYLQPIPEIRYIGR
jgi:hypothetical protein